MTAYAERERERILGDLGVHAQWFWLATPNASGAIVTDERGIVRTGCPYLASGKVGYVGRPLNGIIGRLRLGGNKVEWARIVPRSTDMGMPTGKGL